MSWRAGLNYCAKVHGAQVSLCVCLLGDSHALMRNIVWGTCYGRGGPNTATMETTYGGGLSGHGMTSLTMKLYNKI